MAIIFHNVVWNWKQSVPAYSLLLLEAAQWWNGASLCSLKYPALKSCNNTWHHRARGKVQVCRCWERESTLCSLWSHPRRLTQTWRPRLWCCPWALSFTAFVALEMMNEVYAWTNILTLQCQKCFRQGQVAWRAALVSLWPGLSAALMDEVVDQRLCWSALAPVSLQTCRCDLPDTVFS